MSLLKDVKQMFQFVFDAAGRVFSPSDDRYPEIGVQPFEGEIVREPRKAN